MPHRGEGVHEYVNERNHGPGSFEGEKITDLRGSCL